MKYKYMREDLKDSYGILQLQDKILEIACYIDDFCKNNNIDYCLMGGSALGAKRHSGFIPWDDDLDIFMTPDNYEKFRELFKKSGNQDLFYLQELCATEGMVSMSKLRMNNTIYIENSLKNWDIHHGIFVDIFLLHNCPNNRIRQFFQCCWAKYVVLKGLAIRKYDRRKGLVTVFLKVLSCFPDKFLIKCALNQVYKYRNKKCDYYCHFFGRAIFKNAVYKKEWFSPTEYINFEKTKLKIPTNVHEFLKRRFGDYMKLPSEEQIKWYQHAEAWDTLKSYKEINKTNSIYNDEKRLF